MGVGERKLALSRVSGSDSSLHLLLSEPPRLLPSWITCSVQLAEADSCPDPISDLAAYKQEWL